MGTMKFELKDHLNHHRYQWPLSMVRYPLRFALGEAHPDGFVLRDVAGAPVAMQLTGVKQCDGFVTEAALCFMTDLPRGESRLFELEYGAEPLAKSYTEPSVVTDMDDQAALTVCNGELTVVLPSETKRYLTPIEAERAPDIFCLGLADGAVLARARVVSRQPLTAVESECIASGPVFHEQRISCMFQNGASYTINIRLFDGMPYVELDEKMAGIDKKEDIRFVVSWEGLAPDRRYARNRGEEPVDAYLGDEGEMPFRLLPYDNARSWHRCRTALFTNNDKRLAAGVFHGDAEKWDDGEYALWRSSDTLAIRFFYKDVEGDEVLQWFYPLADGRRETKIAMFERDQRSRALPKEPVLDGDASPIDELALWHAFLTLDKVKDWVLNWEEPQEQYPLLFDTELPKGFHWWYFDRNEPPCPQDMEEVVGKLSYSFNNVLHTSPVTSREFASWVPMFDLSAKCMTKEQFDRFKAASAFMAYVREDEYVAPIRTMLAGHPNFLADFKAVPGYMSALFPNHPHASRWRDHFEQSVALNLKYHTRPAVGAWQSEGGRWTENLGCYVWAALVPMLRAAWCIRKTHRLNTLLHPNMASLARWLLNSLSAPVAGRRSYPPQGAHSGAHHDPFHPPYALRVLGEMLRAWEPRLAEELLAVCPPDAEGFESSGKDDIWRCMLTREDDGRWNEGTSPRLKSVKYTGYGFVLRAEAGTPGEMSVHLQQIDEGPNYRWGRSGNGGNGVIYYYGDGKRYSYNRPEDVGDDNMAAGEGSSSFAVLSGHEYAGIGRGDLTGPLYDFGFAQYAVLEAGPDSRPMYRSRSVVMSGNDYIAIYDEVADMRVRGRFSWFSHRDEPFPDIYQLKPGVAASDVLPGGPVDAAPIAPGTYTRPKVKHGYPDGSKGKYYDGFGDFLTVVTHRGSWQPQVTKVKATDFGAVVALCGRTDYIFRDASRIRHSKGDIRFDGYAGIVRHYGEGHAEAALFRGRLIGAAGIVAEVADVEAGLGDGGAVAGNDEEVRGKGKSGKNEDKARGEGKSGEYEEVARGRGNSSKPEDDAVWGQTAAMEGAFSFTAHNGKLRGSFTGNKSLRIKLELPAAYAASHYRLCVGGRRLDVERSEGDDGRQTVIFTLPAGCVEWQWTDGEIEPSQVHDAVVSIASPGEIDIAWSAAVGAEHYRIAISEDGGDTWQTAADDIRALNFRLGGLRVGAKLHVKVCAMNGTTVGRWSVPCPVYVADRPPIAPEGLQLKRTGVGIEAVWGQAPGAQGYRLYRRRQDESANKLIYEGSDRIYTDDCVAESHAEVYAYSVSAVNGIGEGARSFERDTRPGGLIDWDPMPQESFRRYTRSHEYGYAGFDYWANERKGSLPPYPG